MHNNSMFTLLQKIITRHNPRPRKIKGAGLTPVAAQHGQINTVNNPRVTL